MQVSSDLSLGGAYPVGDQFLEIPIPGDNIDGMPNTELSNLPSQWTSGTFEVIADDGSRMSLSPMPDDSSSALVTIEGIDEPLQVLWSDGFQVKCFSSASGTFDCGSPIDDVN